MTWFQVFMIIANVYTAQAVAKQHEGATPLIAFSLIYLGLAVLDKAL